jgi:hypothetical protein
LPNLLPQALPSDRFPDSLFQLGQFAVPPDKIPGSDELFSPAPPDREFVRNAQRWARRFGVAVHANGPAFEKLPIELAVIAKAPSFDLARRLVYPALGRCRSVAAGSRQTAGKNETRGPA